MSKRCDECGLKKTPMIYLSLTRKLCRSCETVDRENKKNLIMAIKDIADKAPPLGYHVFPQQYLSDQQQGKVFADVLFQYQRTGSVN